MCAEWVNSEILIQKKCVGFALLLYTYTFPSFLHYVLLSKLYSTLYLCLLRGVIVYVSPRALTRVVES